MVKTYFSNRGVELTDEQAQKIEEVARELLILNPWGDPLDAIFRLITPPSERITEKLRRVAREGTTE
jgi:hypothetical protein